MVLSSGLNLINITLARFISTIIIILQKDILTFLCFSGYFGAKGPVNEPELPLLCFFALQNWFARNL